MTVVHVSTTHPSPRPGSPWKVVFVAQMNAWAVGNENWDGEWAGDWKLQEQAEMAVLLLDEEGIDYDEGMSMADLVAELENAVRIERCMFCEKDMMACQMHNDRCPAHVS